GRLVRQVVAAIHPLHLGGHGTRSSCDQGGGDEARESDADALHVVSSFGRPARAVDPVAGHTAQRPCVSRPTSMKRRTLPVLLSGVPERFQNSMRLPVPVCTFTITSLTTVRSRGCSTPGQPLYSV